MQPPKPTEKVQSYHPKILSNRESVVNRHNHGFLRTGVWSSGNVGVQLHPGREGHRDVGQHGGHGLSGRVHERRVEGAGHHQS